MNLLLQRTSESPDGPTFGTMTDADSGCGRCAGDS